MPRIQAPVKHGDKYRARAADGTRHTFDTEPEAEGFIAEQLALKAIAKRTGKRLAKTEAERGETLAEFRASWAPDRPVTPRTAESQDGYWRNHIEPYLGSRRLREITKTEVNAWLLTLERAGRSKDVRYQSRAHLSAMMTAALDADKIDAHPVRGSRRQGLPNRKPRHYEGTEVERLLKATEDDAFRLMLRFIAETGVRISEAIGLEIDSLMDLGKPAMARVVVYQVAERDQSTRPTLKGGEGSSRSIVLGPELARDLAAHIKGKRKSGRVFTDDEGQALDYYALRDAKLNPAITAAGLDGERWGFHALRHYAITSWIEANVPLPTVQYLAGHESIKTTQGYVHTSDAGMQAARAARTR